MADSTKTASQVNGKVAKVLDNGQKLVINRGREHGVHRNQIFKVFQDGGDIVDPETGDNLGSLQVQKGFGKAIQVQDKMAVLEFYDPETEVRRYPHAVRLTTSIDELLGAKKQTKTVFNDVQIGDNVVSR